MAEPNLQLADPAEMVLAQEHLALRERVLDARERANRLRALTEHVEQRAARDEHALAELDGALGIAAQLQIEQLERQLTGCRLREIAVDVLSRELEPGQVVHYRQWFALLRAAGYHVKGKDPWPRFSRRSTAPTQSSSRTSQRQVSPARGSGLTHHHTRGLPTSFSFHRPCAEIRGWAPSLRPGRDQRPRWRPAGPLPGPHGGGEMDDPPATPDDAYPPCGHLRPPTGQAVRVDLTPALQPS
jgi:hypothetical protein